MSQAPPRPDSCPPPAQQDRAVEAALAAAEELLPRARQGDAAAREALWRWLESFRCESALRAVAAAGQEQNWCRAVEQVLQAIDLTVGELLRRRAETYGDRTLFVTPGPDQLEEHSWTEVAEHTAAIARGLAGLRTTTAPIALYAPNGLPTALCDLACLCHGLTNAVLPGTAAADHLGYILDRTEAEVALVGDAQHYERLQAAGPPAAALRHLVVLDPTGVPRDPRVVSLAELRARGEGSEALPPPAGLTDVATVMFTSGTTGQPKGIPFTHLNLVFKRYARALALPFVQDNNVFVSYLPLYHTFGRWLEMLGTIFWGGIYCFGRSPSIGDLTKQMRLLGATGFISVPQKWLQLREEVGKQVDLETATDRETAEALAELTGGRLRWGLSAAGHLEPEVFTFFQRHGVDLLSGFGMTEATGGITMTPPGQYREGTVGKALPGIELRVADDGELLVRGPYVAGSYYRSDEPDDRPDGWFATGDLVTMDRQGFVTIVDRKKELYKNLRGETIAPQRIENLFADFPGVKRVFLVGDHRPYNTLLIVADLTLEEPNLQGFTDSELEEFFRPYVVAVNRFLADHERVVDFAVLRADFTEDAGELTAKQTLKRRVIEQRHAALLEPMYRRQYVELTAADYTVRVPRWFLRTLGIPENALVLTEGALELTETGRRLTLHRCDGEENRFRLGSRTYQVTGDRLDLDLWLRDASLWVGNADLVAFTGPEIAGWRATSARDEVTLCLECRHAAAAGVNLSLEDIPEGPNAALLALHVAAALLAEPTADEAAALQAVTHLEQVLDQGTHEFVALARSRLAWAAYHDCFAVRAPAYRALLRGEVRGQYKGAFGNFLASGKPFLDEATIESIYTTGLDDAQLTSLRERMERYRRELTWPQSEETVEQFRYLLELFTNHGLSHPASYSVVRSELAEWQLFNGDRTLRYAAERNLERLVREFRHHYAPPELGTRRERRARWDPLLEFELGIEASEQARLRDAFATTCLLWEAVHVLYGGHNLTAADLKPGGIWILQRGGRFGTSLFQVLVETKQDERFEFDLSLNRSQSPLHFHTTELMRMAYGELPNRPPGIARLGGLWLNEGLATREHVSGETLESFWRRAAQEGREVDNHTYWQCKHHLRLALAACLDFWNRTQRTLMLAAPSPRDVIIPVWQVTRTVRLFNIADREAYSDVSEVLLGLYRGFYRSLWNLCPTLRELLDPALILQAFMDVFGMQEGLDLVAEGVEHLQHRPEVEAHTKDMLASALRDREAIRRVGFRPLPLRAAVQRYRRWLGMNPAATAEARLQTLIGLYRWHGLHSLERQYPEVRFRLFRETVWRNCEPPLAAALDRAIQSLRGATEAQRQILRRVSEIRLDLELTPEDDTYLTWLTYPYLDPARKARLMRVVPAVRSYSPLTTTLTDTNGRHYEVRGARTPREVARLTWLFRRAGVNVAVQPDHEVLVTLDDRQVLVGGVVYSCPDPDQAFIRGVVIGNTCQGSGLGRALVEDLLSRLQGEDVKIVTVDFALPEFWRALGFEAKPEYGGLVRFLDRDSDVPRLP